MKIRQDEIRNLHPCFNAGNNKGRMHLPVSPACNICCKFCSRVVGGDAEEIRPGVAQTLVAPEEAADYVRKALDVFPDITVVGIAGPGDTLATDHAFRAFANIRAQFPHLIHCMSTNGLLLPKKIDDVVNADVTTLTVTVNAVDPDILTQINGGVVWNGEYLDNAEGAFTLIKNQLEGIRLASEAGIIVKVNTVLIPRINGKHIGTIAKAVAGRGASIFNIIPLIPMHMLADEQAPGCEAIDAARGKAERYLPVFRHCQHCRADAIGMLGGPDYGGRVYQQRVEDTFSHG
jgi:nitrogen fixation protein NifB